MKLHSYFRALFLVAVLLSPVFVFAQGGDLQGVATNIFDVIKALIPIVFALALLYFFWGLAKYILAAGNEASKQDGKGIMIWGIIALFVMVSVWGLVKILQATFNISDSENITLPAVPENYAGC